MASTYKTPGVKVEEISTLPASVAQVETAIPAFIGYTEKAIRDGVAIEGATRITSLMDYVSLFGGPQSQTGISASLSTNADKKITVIANAPEAPSKYLMYHSMKMFFNNGGGPCYIISIGQYSGLIEKDPMLAGLAILKTEDEPTLIVFPDSVNLPSSAAFYAVYQASLAQCATLQDRFAVTDVWQDPAVTDWNVNITTCRDGVGMASLKYGAVYYPFLKTSLNYPYNDADVTVNDSGDFLDSKFVLTLAMSSSSTYFTGDQLPLVAGSAVIDAEYTSGDQLISDLDALFAAGGFPLAASKIVKIKKDTDTTTSNDTSTTLLALKTSDNERYNLVKAELTKLTMTLPPSSAVVGVYARVDADRGVWKAPANVSLSSVIEPAQKITNEEQRDLNVHTTGKSVNAIRTFAGKGVLIWGARTLAGNDNEWRYVPVRRFFNMVEESVKKATEFVVFEPNDANTWMRTKAMIENYLTGLWRAGALAGAKPDDAFFVNVGLGTTMTSQDILEGRMIIEIGMAAVRPAEFIILRFSHKLQE